MRHKAFNWSRLRKISQLVFLVLWLVLWVATAGLSIDRAFTRLPAELDPLLAITQAISSRTLTIVMLLSLIVLGLTVVFGRAWCGWICPVGTILDFFPFRKAEKARKPVPENWRAGKYLVLLVILIAALFGNLTLLILDPITLWVRTLTGSIGPVLNTLFTAAERGLSNISWMGAPLMTIDRVMRPAVFPLEGVGIRLVWLPSIIFLVLIVLNVIAERFWCRYLCPLGGLLGLISRFALVRRQVDAECASCGRCSTVCPTGTIDADQDYASDPAECTMCMDCLKSCPTSRIRFSRTISLHKRMTYDPGRRQVLAAGGVALLGLAVMETKSSANAASNYLLRPPGAENDELLQKCLRCGLCIRTCPTGALQASVKESGLEGLFTPVVVPRLGYCLYSCNKCGEICPVQAIPALTLEEKHNWVIGNAFIDHNRCIPWADGTTCIVCEEMCPLPEKAITLEVRQVTRSDGSSYELRLPVVDRDKCIGCGICEYKCPRAGEAAIRVYRNI